MSLNSMILAIEKERALNIELRDKLIGLIDEDIARLQTRRNALEVEFEGRDAAYVRLIDDGPG